MHTIIPESRIRENPHNQCESAIGRTVRIDKAHDYNYIVIMDAVRFEWDKVKNSENIRKHNVSFEEAETIFVDEKALLIHDPDHSAEEDRFILLGMSARLRILLVCHCYRAHDEIIRIISARKASRTEQKQYWERQQP